MTWEPKNKLDDEDVDVSDDEDKDNSFSRDDKSGKHPTRFLVDGIFIKIYLSLRRGRVKHLQQVFPNYSRNQPTKISTLTFCSFFPNKSAP